MTVLKLLSATDNAKTLNPQIRSSSSTAMEVLGDGVDVVELIEELPTVNPEGDLNANSLADVCFSAQPIQTTPMDNREEA